MGSGTLHGQYGSYGSYGIFGVDKPLTEASVF